MKTEEIKQYVLDLIQKKAKIPEGSDLSKLNYIRSGYVDSMGLIKFVVQLEQRFDIEIADEDMESEEFAHVGGLVSLIERKMESK